MKKIDLEKDLELKKHINSLGLKSIKDYTNWCKLSGFSQGLNKNSENRKKELSFLKTQKSKEVFIQSKSRLQSIDKIIKGVFQNKISETEILKDAKLAQIYSIYKSVSDSNKEYFLDFILTLENESDLLKSRTLVVQEYGNALGNSYVEALSEIFNLKDRWIRPIRDWIPKSHNVVKQFSSLVRHLFTEYSIPLFMDSAWFSNQTKYRQWFLIMASGQNIRKVSNFPLEYTKRMAHNFLQAPDHYTIENAVRWGQIKGMDGDSRLVEAVNQTILGKNFENPEFWNSVINVFVLSPMLDRTQIGPIIDYIFNQKFTPNAPQPNFCMKGRTADTLMKQTEEWHARLAKEKPKGIREWKSTGILPFRKEEGLEGRQSYRVWMIKELLTSKELFDEGRVQKHCVGSYSSSCMAGRTSIWSLRMMNNHQEDRILTIEVNNNNKSIVQARGKLNVKPDSRAYGLLCEWAGQVGLSVNV